MFVECFGGGLPAEGFTGSTVQSCGDSVQVVPGVSAEVGAFGEVLAEEAVGDAPMMLLFLSNREHPRYSQGFVG